MKTIKNKQILVAADVAGYVLKDAVVAHLVEEGWEVTDIGVKDKEGKGVEIFHRMAIRAASMVSEGEFDRALLFCGTGMGVHLAANKVPRCQAAVVESVPSALRAITGNGVNIMCMGGYYIAPQMGIEIADAFLNNDLGSGYEWWNTFYEYHKFAHDEIDNFNYEEYKKNGFKFPNDETPIYDWDGIKNKDKLGCM
ncbi:MAG: RpiB/LacA/LacB family sugar-phosphate isomerase [Vallitaleaceae bacterium]|nr:RpiB/LacA/LacB family sugar-phosphate isomerase [Vallitaleaceae bacterium]